MGLLVVLALLLPLRGAVAAAMTCHLAGAGAVAVAAAAHAEHAAHDHAAQADASAPAASDKCNLCAASCSLTPLLGAPPSVIEPSAAAAVRFPVLDARAPSFLSDGQERPPRTI